MYHVVKDTLRCIVEAGLPLECSALGVEVPLKKLVSNNYCLSNEMDCEIMARLQACVADRNALRLGQNTWLDEHSHKDGVTLTFDPLYLGFSFKRSYNLTFVLDLTPLTRPQWHNPSVSDLYTHAYSHLYDSSVESISISHSTTRDLWANLGIPSCRVHTIHLYNRFERTPIQRDATTKSFLFVGSLEPRKNIEGLAKAFGISQLHEQGYTLRVVGQEGHNANHIREICSTIPGVNLLGRLSDDELTQEYSNCMCLVFPSLWEGFGLPALEAMALNIPLLLSDSGALPEIGGHFASYVDPCDIYSISNGLCLMAKKPDRTNEYSSELIEWLNKFSRTNYEDRIINLLRSKL